MLGRVIALLQDGSLDVHSCPLLCRGIPFSVIRSVAEPLSDLRGV